jgi:hypothetical protein
MLASGLNAIAALGLLSPLWMPLAFVFYAIWPERLNRQMVLAFALAECLSFGLAYAILAATGFGA